MATPRVWTSEEVALLEDIAERTWAAVEHARAEKILREGEEQMRLIVESARDYAIFTLDAARNVTSWNAGAEAIAWVFRPFEQADETIARQFGGLGLGLAIAKGTVEAHGGENCAPAARVPARGRPLRRACRSPETRGRGAVRSASDLILPA